MKITIYTFPYIGHTAQAAKIANYLRQQGHDVVIDIKKNYLHLVNDKINTTECLYDFESNISLNFSKDTLLNYCEGILQTSLKYLNDFSKQSFKPDIIIFDSLAYWGKIISRKYHIKGISLMTIQPFTEDEFNEDGYRYLSVYSKYYKNNKSFYRALFIEQICAIKKYDLFDDFSFSDLICAKGDKNIVLLPKALCKYYDRLDDSFCGFSPILENFSQEKKDNIIYISTGSMVSNKDFIETCLQSLLPTGKKLHVSVGNNVDFFSKKYKNDNIFFYKYAPQVEILKKASLFITHAGSNSICEAIKTKTPMITIPIVNDEFINSEMVESIGIGCQLSYDLDELKEFLQKTANCVLNDNKYTCSLDKLSIEINSLNLYNTLDKCLRELNEEGI